MAECDKLVTDQVIEDFEFLLTFLNYIKDARRHFVRKHPNGDCDCLTAIASKETLDKKETEIKSLKEVAIIVKRFQSTMPFPSITQSIFNRMYDNTVELKAVKELIIAKRVMHNIDLKRLL